MKLKHYILSLLALPLLFSCGGKAESAQEAAETEPVIPPLGFRTAGGAVILSVGYFI